MVWNFYLLSQKIRRDRQRKNFLKQGVQNMFSSAISGGIFLRHLAGSNSLYSNRTERSDAYRLRCSFRQQTSKITKEESNARIHIHNYDQLPLFLNANTVAQVLGVSISSAYELMHETGFPALRIGNRIVVPKEKFRQWVDAQAGGDA